MLNLSDWEEKVSSELDTVADYLRWSMTLMGNHDVFMGHGMDSLWEEAIALLYGTLSLPYDIDPSIAHSKLLIDERKQFIRNVYRRVIEKTPTAYITQKSLFAGLSFYVDDRVIIPRSPIAELIEDEFSPWIGDNEINRALDMCTGSGCIAVGMSIIFQDAVVDAVDISNDALDVARINVEDYGVSERINIIKSNLFESIYPDNQYDIIVANPPYVGEEEYSHLPAEYLHEPKISLIANNNGLDFAIKILASAHQYLSRNGILILEVGYSKPALESILPDIPFTWLQFQHGGDGVLLITYEELIEYQSSITILLDKLDITKNTV